MLEPTNYETDYKYNIWLCVMYPTYDNETRSKYLKTMLFRA